jgi:hypothetical protein
VIKFDKYPDTLRRLLAAYMSFARLGFPDERIKVVFGPTKKDDPRLGGCTLLVDGDYIQMMVHGGTTEETDEQVLRDLWVELVEDYNRLPQEERHVEWHRWQTPELFAKLCHQLVVNQLVTPEEIMARAAALEAGV